MQTTGVDTINSTVEKTHMWLQLLMDEGGLNSEAQAYSVLRAVLHTLRDRLTVDEAAHLASHLPLLLKGVYYDGWKPAQLPQRLRTVDKFLASIADRLGNAAVDPETACRTVFRFLNRKIDAGEIQDVRHMLPHEIRDLWEAPPHPTDARRF